MERPVGFYPASFLEEAANLFQSQQEHQQPRPSKEQKAPTVPACPKQTAGFGHGPKACAQCGTTRTPQWREGPAGPKTLCNACGVKRVRAMRLTQEGGKRRPPPSKSPAALFKQCPAAAEAGEDAYDSRESGHRRPLRRAAARSAAKTADLASRGQWGEQEEGELSFRSSQATSSADSAHNSDSAEEVAWVPEAHGSPRLLPPSPMAGAVGPECAAAVNLLSMSVHDQPLPATLRPAPAAAGPAAAGEAAKQLPRINASSFAQMANSALKWATGAPGHAAAQEALAEALRALPPEQHAAMLAAKRELDAISREAAAADAAVAAVAKILAMKQVAAIRARASAAAAAKRVRKVMQGLDEEHGWSRQAAAKRPRA